MKIVFLDTETLGEVDLTVFNSFGDFSSFPLTSANQKIQRGRGAEIIITNKVIIDKELMDSCPQLKLVCLAATGMNNVDLDYAAIKGIQVKNVAGYSTESVVQTTFGLILSLLCHIPYFDQYVKSGAYTQSPIFTHYGREFNQIAGKQLGIIGLGQIGKRVGGIAKAFGMNVSYYSTSGSNNDPDYPRLSLEELLKNSDVVSVHAPLNTVTLGLINRERLSWMKKTAVILNLGRGGIIVETDLARALDEEWIAGAAMDVFTMEPLPADHPFLCMKHPERILLTPHIAWASREARMALVDGIVKNIRNYLKST